MKLSRIRIVLRFGARGATLSPWVSGSIAVHVLVTLALILVPSLFAGPKIPPDAMIVNLVAAPAATPIDVRPRQNPPPAPPAQPTPPPEGPRIETREPPKPEPLPEEIPPEPKQDEPREPTPKPPAGPTGPPDPAPGEAGGVTSPPVEEGASITSAVDTDFAYAWYRDAVTAALYSHWRKPVVDRLREPREVRVAFEIARDGSVRSPRIEQSSGVASLDRSALRAVADASPLPPLPATWKEPVLSAAFVFTLYPG